MNEDIEIKQKEIECIKNKILELENSLYENHLILVKKHDRHYGISGNKITHVDFYIRGEGRLTEKDTKLHEEYINKFIDYIKKSSFYLDSKVDRQSCSVGKRICDVFLTKKNSIKKVCCEIQLSPVSFKELELRTIEYLSNKYRVIWVLPLEGDACRQHVFWRLLNKFKNNGYLYSYCKSIKSVSCIYFVFDVYDEWYSRKNKYLNEDWEIFNIKLVVKHYCDAKRLDRCEDCTYLPDSVNPRCVDEMLKSTSKIEGLVKTNWKCYKKYSYDREVKIC